MLFLTSSISLQQSYEIYLSYQTLIPTFFFFSSIGTVTLVSAERFLAICHPFKHRLMRGTKRTNLLICLTWTVAFSSTLLMYSVTEALTICVIWPNHSFYNDFPNFLYTTRLTWVFNFIVTPIFVISFLILFISNCYIF